jgi:DnaK suppressor protein
LPPRPKSPTNQAPVSKAPVKKAPVPAKSTAKNGASAPVKATGKAVPPKATAAKPRPPATKEPAAKPPKTVAPPKAPARTGGASSASKDAAPKAPVSKAPAKRAATVAPKPRVVSQYMADAKFIEKQKALLIAERVTYLEQAHSLRAEAEALVLEMEPGDIQFDDESGEGGTVTVDRERDLALSAQALGAVEEIDEALTKITRGTYGICEGNGELIAKARLEALPYAKLCIACKSGGLSRR